MSQLLYFANLFVKQHSLHMKTIIQIKGTLWNFLMSVLSPKTWEVTHWS